MSVSANIARYLPQMAALHPERIAVKISRGRTGAGAINYLSLTFLELDAEVDAWVHHLHAKGVRSGDRVLVMVRQGLPLIAAAFALFKLGAVPVIIDPGMGRKNFLECVARSTPRVLLGIPLAQAMSHVFRTAFKTVSIRIWVSGAATARRGSVSSRSASSTQPVSSLPTDLAAILFTSGSTGAPKGVCYEHGMFEAQVRLVQSTYTIEPGEVDLPMLPIFALFNPALGMTTIVPEIDPSRPAAVDPEKIVRAIQQEKVTSSFGSPTLWRKIARYCERHAITLPSVKRVLMAGAPVPPQLFADLKKILPNGTAYSPYGATESLPVASISGDEVLAETAAATARGEGTCVGRAVNEVSIKIIAITAGPLVDLASVKELSVGEIGEIIVSGPVVTREYDNLPAATALAKIKETPVVQPQTPNPGPQTPIIWHRIGDLGYLDTQGRLWFCGRKAERVITREGPLYTEQVEPIFNAHPEVLRSALIGVGHDGMRAAIVVEPVSRAVVATPSLRRKLVRELRALGAQHQHTDMIRLAYLHPHFPVDVRHNAKIHRLKLAEWATGQHGYELDKREVPLDALKR